MTALIVLPALRRGLAPLDRLGEQAAQIGPASLQSRFARSGMPVELRPITDRLNDLMGRLEDAFEREHRFSSDLAHELRTPIAEIKAMAEVALRWPDQVDTESFRDVLQTTIRMEGLLENLLAMSRLEWRAAKTERTRVNVTDLVAEAWQPQVEAAAEKHIRYTASCPPSLTTNTNASLLRVILDNLLGNAVAYTPDGGDIHVAGSLPAAGGFALTVGNAVTGVHAADLPRFFERLWRGDASRAQDPHLGLGLPLAKACAGILGLTLRAELSADESWLTFHLEPAAA
jgi:signal transduction histidine kinase